MRIKLISVILLFYCLSLWSAADPDSLKNALTTATGVDRILLLQELSQYYKKEAPHLSLEYGLQTLQEYRGDDRNLLIDLHITVAEAYESMSDRESAVNYYLKALPLAEDNRLRSRKAYLLFSLGENYSEMIRYDKALFYYNQAATIYKQVNILDKYASILNRTGIIYETLSIYDIALDYYLSAFRFYQQSEDIQGMSHSLNNTGNIYNTMGDYYRALDYYNRALTNYQSLNDKSGISTAYNNMAIVYDDMGDLDKAYEYYWQSLQLAREIEEKEGIATALNNIAIIHYNRKLYDIALQEFLESLQLSRELNDKWAIANTHMNIGDLYLDMKKSREGLNSLYLGLQIAQEMNFRDLILEYYKIYTKYLVQVEDYQNAYELNMKYQALKDSIFVESRRRIAGIQTVFETEKKEREIEILNLSQLNQRYLKIFFILISVLLLIAATWLYRLYYQKNREIKAREKLEKDVLRLAAVVNQTESSIIIMDLTGSMVYANPYYLAKRRKELKDIIGNKPDFLHKNFKIENMENNIWQMITSGTVWSGTLQTTDTRGEKLYESALIFPIKDDKNTIISYAAVKHDISDIINAEKDLKTSEERFRKMAENISDGLAIIEEGKVVYVNKRLCEITGYDKDELKEKSGFDLAAPFEQERIRKIAEQSKENPESLHTLAYWIVRKDGQLRYINNGYSMYREKGKIVNRYIAVSDLTEYKEYEQKLLSTLQEKNILLQEINHRVKNNMQIIASLLKLQAGHIKDRKILNLFKNCQDRVKSMALIHEKLYKSEDLTNIDFMDYVKDLVRYLCTTYTISQDRIQLLFAVKEVKIGVNKAIPLGLITNELVSNSLKYAFPDGRKGKIMIGLEQQGNKYILTVSDDGIGIPADIDLQDVESLGMQLVQSLSAQIHGKARLLREKGTTFLIEFNQDSEEGSGGSAGLQSQ